MALTGWIRPAVVAGAAALLLAACGGGATGGTGSSGGSGGGGGSTTPTPTATPAASSGSASTVKTATATVQGKSETILVNGQGLTLYYYTPDKDMSVTCTGGCASAWPPVTAGSSPQSPISGVSGTFGSDPNPAGGSVVTYNGWPLYTYARDTGAGQTSGQSVGGVWFIATPSLAASATGQ
ncbi:MAG: COG4315 family predicted lipoprotein [Candidatus Dormibacteraceae bacterium]